MSNGKSNFSVLRMKTLISNIKIMHLIMFSHLVSQMESDRKVIFYPFLCFLGIFHKIFDRNFRTGINHYKYSKRYKKDLSQLCVIIICEEKRSANFCDQNKIIRATQKALNFKTHVTKISFSNFRKIANFEENRKIFQFSTQNVEFITNL